MLLAVAACANASGGDDPRPQPPEPTRFDRPEMVRFHMRRHFDDLRQVERLLLAGKLDEARARAYLLTQPATDPGMAPWSAEIEDVRTAARSLAALPGIDEGLRREARVAEACAYCHVRTQNLPVFPELAAAPHDTGAREARMARHQWAADRLWEGIVGGGKTQWRAGLDVLATTPLPFPPTTDAPALAKRLQDLARTALEKHVDGSETLAERARLYGEMLVTCAACHRTLGARPSDR